MVPEEWYYSKDATRKGPIDLDALKKLLESGYVSRGDLVWKQGLAEWVKAGDVKELSVGPPPLPNTEPELVRCELDDQSVNTTDETSSARARRRAFEPAIGAATAGSTTASGKFPQHVELPAPPVAPTTDSPTQTPPSDSSSPKVESPFAHVRDLQVPSPKMVLVCSCLLLLPLAAMTAAYTVSATQDLSEILMAFSLFVGLPTLVLFCVFSAVYIHQAWTFVPEQQRTSSPGMMVGLLFIPVFNFIWLFFAVPGLSSATNRLVLPYETIPRAPQGLGVAFCLAFPLAFIWSPAPAILLFGMWVVAQTEVLTAIHALAHGKPPPQTSKPPWFKAWVVVYGSATAASVLVTALLFIAVISRMQSTEHVQEAPQGVRGFHDARWGMTAEEVERCNLIELEFMSRSPKSRFRWHCGSHETSPEFSPRAKGLTCYYFRRDGTRGLVAVREVVEGGLSGFHSHRNALLIRHGRPNRKSPDGYKAMWRFPNGSTILHDRGADGDASVAQYCCPSVTDFHPAEFLP